MALESSSVLQLPHSHLNSEELRGHERCPGVQQAVNNARKACSCYNINECRWKLNWLVPWFYRTYHVSRVIRFSDLASNIAGVKPSSSSSSSGSS